MKLKNWAKQVLAMFVRLIKLNNFKISGSYGIIRDWLGNQSI